MKFFVSLFFLIIISCAICQGQNQDVSQALDKMCKGYIVESYQDLNKYVRINDIIAQFLYAQCNEKGYGTKINKTEAFRYYRKTAERGLAVGQIALANCYRLGIGTMVNAQKAEYWETKAAGRYNPDDLTLIDKCYLEGLKYSQNYSLASNNGGALSNTSNNNINVGNNINSNNTTINITYANTQPVHASTLEPTPVKHERPLLADVDTNIPLGIGKNESTFVVIIANENYQDVAKVPYTINDGEIFAEYCKRTLGIPETNISLVKDATANNMKREVRWLTQILQQYNGEAKAIVYYAGHGIPDESTKDAYLLPVDGYGDDPSTGYSLNELYKTLNEVPSKSTLVFLDACFSGANRDGSMLASARGVAIKAKPTAPIGNMVVFSAAQGDETAYPYKDKGHGLFTYYFLKKLQETKGDVTLGELSEYITDQVGKQSIVINRKSQTPNVSVSSSLQNVWKKMKIQ